MTDASQGQDQPAELVYWWSPRGDERVFDLSGWPDDALAAAKAVIDEDGMAHSWEGTDLVVAAAQRDDAAALLDEVVAAAQPGLDADADRTGYDLTDWPDYELETLRVALEDAGIIYEWTEESELLVYEADEARVDELFDRLELRGPNPGVELDGEALTSLLTTLFMASDRLATDPDDANAILDAHRAVLDVEQLAVPYGMNGDAWQVLVADATELRRLVEDEAGGYTAVTPAAATSDAVDDDQDDALDDRQVDADDDGVVDAVLDEDEETVLLSGDEAIVAVASRLRDRLKRLL